MFGDGSLTFQEFILREPLPLATIQDAVLEFLRGRKNIALFGAQAVNAYLNEPCMTQTVDLMSTRAAEVAEEVRLFLASRFKIAARVRDAGREDGYRIYQLHKPRNRHLVDVRAVAALPATREVDQVQVIAPADLVALKVVALNKRRGQPTSGTDWRDVAMLLLTFPDLKTDRGAVRQRLEAAGADAATIASWQQIVTEPIVPPEDQDF